MGLFSKIKKAQTISKKVVKHIEKTTSQPSSASTGHNKKAAPKAISNPATQENIENFSNAEKPCTGESDGAISIDLSEINSLPQQIHETYSVDLSNVDPKIIHKMGVPRGRKWDFDISPEEEYLTVLPGEKDEKLIDNGAGECLLLTREHKSIEVPAACGFMFNNVIVHTTAKIDRSTGEVGDSPLLVVPYTHNLTKMMNDWRDLNFFWEFVHNSVPEFPMEGTLSYINNLGQLLHRNDETYPNNFFRDFDYKAQMLIEPLTETGRIKKYPITTSIIIQWDEPIEEWLESGETELRNAQRIHVHLESSYLENGRVGKGMIVLNVNGVHFRLKFAYDAKEECYYIKEVVTNNGLSVGAMPKTIAKNIYPAS